ncbi:MAG: glycosyltransferase family 39 protein [Cyanobium sp.]
MSERSGQPLRPANPHQRTLIWWLLLLGLWVGATAADRLWLAADGRLPSWDQADYLNSALDHGRALGLLRGGGWQGWGHLLDFSPKIPPLASLIDGSVMALSGETADQASWSLALWHGLLLAVVACWGRQLGGRGFGLLAAALVALAPALTALRVDYTLDIPLTASTTLALWLLGRWQAQPPAGGRWPQAILAALAVAGALLVKQSALLLVALPCVWAALASLGQRRRSLQALVALLIVLTLLLPWLHHNWITTLSGTNRAVIESAAAEGDPPPLSLASLLWYPRLWPQQLGLPILVPALAGGLLGLWRGRSPLRARLRRPLQLLPPGWAWLLGCTLAGALATTLSPNKDPRYIAPVLPLLLLLLARGWWQLALVVRRLGGPALSAGLLGGGLLAAAAATAQGALASIERPGPSPIPAAIARLRAGVGDAPTTLLVVPGSPDLNEQTVSYFGRLGGGRIEARRLGRQRHEHPLVLERSSWILLASGDQGTNRPPMRELSLKVRGDGRFESVGSWPWNQGRSVELWRRRGGAAPRFDSQFITLARGMEHGPEGLATLFARIGPEHQLDGHFLYQQRVRTWARQRLRQDPNDGDALWSLALLATLTNRPGEAEQWYTRLAELQPANPWPAAYRAVVQIADWRPGSAVDGLDQAPAAVRQQPVVGALADLSGVLSGRLWRLGALRQHLPPAVEEVVRRVKARSHQLGPHG